MKNINFKNFRLIDGGKKARYIYIVNKNTAKVRNELLTNNYKEITDSIKTAINKNRFILKKDAMLDMEDIINEVYVYLINKIDYSYVAKIGIDNYINKGYIYTLASNIIIDIMRKLDSKKRGTHYSRKHLSTNIIVYLEDLSDAVLEFIQDDNGLYEDVLILMEELKTKNVGNIIKNNTDREAYDILMLKFAGYNYRECGEMLEIKLSTVHNRMNYAKNTIFPKIKDYLEELREEY